MATPLPSYLNLSQLTLDVSLEVTKFSTTPTTPVQPIVASDFTGKNTFTIGMMTDGIGFGITKIDVETNASLQPIVTIEFKDLYGNAVFNKGIGNPNVDYSSIFDWPPPRFVLTFRGYLGHQTSWILSLKKTHTSYNPNDGSYTINASFVPNVWGFFADIPVMYLLAYKKLKQGINYLQNQSSTDSAINKINSFFDLVNIGTKLQTTISNETNKYNILITELNTLQENAVYLLENSALGVKNGSVLSPPQGTTVNNFTNITIKFPSFYATLNPPIITNQQLIDNVNRNEFQQAFNAVNLSLPNASTVEAWKILINSVLPPNSFDFSKCNNIGQQPPKLAPNTSVSNPPSDFDSFKALSSKANTIIKNNLTAIQQAIYSTSAQISQNSLGSLTISDNLSYLAGNAAYILGSILDAGNLGLQRNPIRQQTNSIIGTHFPLMIDGDNNQVPAVGVGTEELDFVNNFISALKSGIAKDRNNQLTNNNNPSNTPLNNNNLFEINNLEIIQPNNPYINANFQGIAENVVQRSGIAAFVTNSNDAKSLILTAAGIDVTTDGSIPASISDMTTLANTELKNITIDIISGIADNPIDTQQLITFCNFFTNLFNSKGKIININNVELPINTDQKTGVPYIGGVTNDDGTINLNNPDGTPNGGVQLNNFILAIKTGNIINTNPASNNGFNTAAFGTLSSNPTQYKNNNNGATYDISIQTSQPSGTGTIILGLDSMFGQFGSMPFGNDSLILTRVGDYLNSIQGIPNNFNTFSASFLTNNGVTYKSPKQDIINIKLNNSQLDTALPIYVLFTNPNDLTSFANTNNVNLTNNSITKVITNASIQDITNLNDIIKNSIVYNYNDLVSGNPNTTPLTISQVNISVGTSFAYSNYSKSSTSSDDGAVWNLFGNSQKSINQRYFLYYMSQQILAELNKAINNNKIINSNSFVGENITNVNSVYIQMHHIYHSWAILALNYPNAKSLALELEKDYFSNAAPHYYGFTYSVPIINLNKNVQPNFNVAHSLISIDPCIGADKDERMTVLNLISAICSKNNFLFIPTPGIFNPKISSNGFSIPNISDIFTPQLSTSPSIGNTFNIMFMPTPESRSALNDTVTTIDQTKKGSKKDLDTLSEINNAFEIQFGSPNNTIVKSINVNTDETKSTAESILNTQNLVDKSNLNKAAEINCSILPVMEGRSYRMNCEVLGNAQISPMQFFYVKNMPVFGGVYQILKVTHNITPNNFVTNFEGVKMRFDGNLANYGAILPITTDTLLKTPISSIITQPLMLQSSLNNIVANEYVYNPDLDVNTPLNSQAGNPIFVNNGSTPTFPKGDPKYPLEVALTNKNVRAFLIMIRISEGTLIKTNTNTNSINYYDGYDYIFGSNTNNSIRLSQFVKPILTPNMFGTVVSKITSWPNPPVIGPYVFFGKTIIFDDGPPSGAYQIQATTWAGLNQTYHFPDFGIHSQDLAAVALLNQRNILTSIMNGSFYTALNQAAFTWASLPVAPPITATHKQPYSQPHKTIAEVQQYYTQAFSSNPLQGGQILQSLQA